MNDKFKSIINNKSAQQKLPINAVHWECSLADMPKGGVASNKHFTNNYSSTNFYKPIALCIDLIPLTS